MEKTHPRDPRKNVLPGTEDEPGHKKNTILLFSTTRLKLQVKCNLLLEHWQRCGERPSMTYSHAGKTKS